MSLYEIASRPFAHPRGWLGGLAARLMLATNGPLFDLAFELLDLQGSERILEVGFGPGELVRRLADRAPRGAVSGVDISELMVRVASERNSESILRGQVSLVQGSVDALPHEDASFDRVVTVNSLPFWPDPARGLAEIARVTAPSGRLVVVVLDHGARDSADVEARCAATSEAIAKAGFREVSSVLRPMRPRPAMGIVATR